MDGASHLEHALCEMEQLQSLNLQGVWCEVYGNHSETNASRNYVFELRCEMKVEVVVTVCVCVCE